MRTTILIALTFALSAVAQQAPPQRQAPPPPGKPKNFTLPEKRETALENGAQLTIVKYGDVPKVTFQVSIQGGNLNETSEGEVWLADVTGAMLAEGTTTRSAAQIAEEAARMGGDLWVAVTANETIVGLEVLSEFAPQAVKLLADVIQAPAFNEEALARIKADKLRALSLAKSEPDQLASERFTQVLYPGHPYGRMFPTEETLKGFTVEKVREFYDAHFGAARTRIYVAGKFEDAEIDNAVRSAFGAMKPGTPAPPVEAKPATARRVHLIDKPGAVQSTLKLGLPVVPVTHPDYVKMRVTNALLGGYFSSRITSNIRESKGYAYSPRSDLATQLGESYWAQNADVTTGVTGAALKEIFYEVDNLQAKPPPEDELKAVQNYLAGSFVLQNSSRAGIIAQLRFVDLHGLPDSYLENYVQNVHAVTPADVQRIARELLQDDKMTIVVVGDRKKIEKQLKPFGKPAVAPAKRAK